MHTALAFICIAAVGSIAAQQNVGLAADVVPTTDTDETFFECLRARNYSAVLVQVFSPALGGELNEHAALAIHNAQNVGLGVEVFMMPQSSKDAAHQVDAIVKELDDSNINVERMWIQVSNVVNWSIDPASNVKFIRTVITRLRSHSIHPGIYTSSAEWKRITDNYKSLGLDVHLWYTHVAPNGIAIDSDPTFADFQQFGGFRAPMAKQFAIQKAECGVVLNKDIYAI